MTSADLCFMLVAFGVLGTLEFGAYLMIKTLIAWWRER
jgi:hypothetical protein